MKNYLLIESRSEYEAADTHAFFALAANLKRHGARVEILLVENGVLPARTGARAQGLANVIGAGIPCAAETFALRERALFPDSLAKGVNEAPLAIIVERMAAGWNVIWH